VFRLLGEFPQATPEGLSRATGLELAVVVNIMQRRERVPGPAAPAEVSLYSFRTAAMEQGKMLAQIHEQPYHVYTTPEARPYVAAPDRAAAAQALKIPEEQVQQVAAMQGGEYDPYSLVLFNRREARNTALSLNLPVDVALGVDGHFHLLPPDAPKRPDLIVITQVRPGERTQAVLDEPLARDMLGLKGSTP